MTTIVSKSSPVLDLETLWPEGCVVFRLSEVRRLTDQGFREGDYVVVEINDAAYGLVAMVDDLGRRMIRRAEDVDGERVIGRVVGLVRSYLEDK